MIPTTNLLLYVGVAIMLGIVQPRMVLGADTGATPQQVAIRAVTAPPAHTTTAPATHGSCAHWNVAAGAALASAALAGTSSADQSLWVTPGAVSWHGQTGPVNAANAGVGLEWHATPSVALVAGAYCNSGWRPSRYVGASYRPWELAPGVRAGIAAAAVTGYGDQPERASLRVGPVLSIEYGRVGVNITAAPRLGESPAFVGIQLKVRVL